MIMWIMKFADGERVHFIDKKERHYPLTLRRGKVFQFSGETIAHDDIIGREDGTTVTFSKGTQFIVIRPTLAEHILKMPRGAQVIYPKDIGMILICGDIYPGATVVEAGIGSGGLTMALLRGVGGRGVVISYEFREDFNQIETMETLLRTWHVEENSVRPDHRMVAHTGFITTARKVAK